VNIYQEIDDKILAAVRSGKATFTDIWLTFDNTGMRVIDRRLQALRKRGLLAYDRKSGWKVVK